MSLCERPLKRKKINDNTIEPLKYYKVPYDEMFPNEWNELILSFLEVKERIIPYISKNIKDSIEREYNEILVELKIHGMRSFGHRAYEEALVGCLEKYSSTLIQQ